MIEIKLEKERQEETLYIDDNIPIINSLSYGDILIANIDNHVCILKSDADSFYWETLHSVGTGHNVLEENYETIDLAVEIALSYSKVKLIKREELLKFLM